MRVGLLTGGGDCPGLNAVIRAITKTAIYQHRMRVIGIEDGFLGLLENRMGELSSLHVSGILTRGGTILGTDNKTNPSRVYVGLDEHNEPRYENRVGECIENIRNAALDALIVIGGDGTMSCAVPFVEAGISCIGVPKTIDNDIVGTDVSFGFLTAVQTATEALDRLHSTAASHHRVMICELMGRNAGWLTLHAGVASGADVILIPEIHFDLDPICRFVDSRRHRGRGFSIVAVAEGAKPREGEQIVKERDVSSADPIRLGGIGKWLADRIQERTDIETRTVALGHVQRGGTPVAADRLLATELGHQAIEMLAAGESGRMVTYANGRVGHIDIMEAANKQRLVPPDHALIRAARGVRTCFGDEA